MIIDKQCEFSLQQRVCNAGATEVSENVYDCGVAAPNIGKGKPITILFTVDEVFAGTATTLTVSVQDCATEGGGYANIEGANSGAIAKATLAAGYQFTITLPQIAHARYLGILYTGDNTFETTGKITAQVIEDFQSNRS